MGMGGRMESRDLLRKWGGGPRAGSTGAGSFADSAEEDVVEEGLIGFIERLDRKESD